MSSLWRRLAVFCDRDLWLSDLRERPGWGRFTLTVLRVVVVVLRGSRDPQRNLEAMSLVESVVPRSPREPMPQRS